MEHFSDMWHRARGCTCSGVPPGLPSAPLRKGMLRTQRQCAALGAPRLPNQASQLPLQQPQPLLGAKLMFEAPCKGWTYEVRPVR